MGDLKKFASTQWTGLKRWLLTDEKVTWPVKVDRVLVQDDMKICTCCAVTYLLEYHLSRLSNKSIPLSRDWILEQYYDAVVDTLLRNVCGQELRAEDRTSIKGLTYEVTHIPEVTVESMVEHLKSGPILVAINSTEEFRKFNITDKALDQISSCFIPKSWHHVKGRHALMLTGFRKIKTDSDEQEIQFLCKNSWGQWGYGGFAWIQFTDPPHFFADIYIVTGFKLLK